MEAGLKSGSTRCVCYLMVVCLDITGNEYQTPSQGLKKWRPQEDAAEVVGLSSRVVQRAEQPGAIKSDQVKGMGLNNCPNQERGSCDRPADPELHALSCLLELL